jgi:hypothetical protein
MIKKWQFGDQIHDHNRGELQGDPEAFLWRDLKLTSVAQASSSRRGCMPNLDFLQL